MLLLMSLEIHDQLVKELRSSGSREIGGLLFAEHLGGEIFRLVEVSVQKKAGQPDGLCEIRRSTRSG